MQEMWEIWVPSLGHEDPLEEKLATHSSILAWRTPWTKWWATVHGVTKSQTWLSDLTATIVRLIYFWLFLALALSFIYPDLQGAGHL